MASTYTTNLGIEKIGTGEQSGTWGETTNLNFDIIDQAINGLVSFTIPAAGSTGSPRVLAITDGALSDGRNAFIEFVDSGDLGGTAYVQLTPNDAEKIAYVRNSLSGGRSVILFQGTYNASNDFELENGKDALLFFNGGGSGAVVSVVQANEVRSGSFQVDNIVLDGNTIDVNGDLDVDVSDGDIVLKDDGTTFGGLSIGGTDTDNLVIKSGSTPTTALTLHEGNVGFGTQDEASFLIDAQSASAGIQARFISTDASASSGPDMKFYKNSASPADGDVISSFFFNANTDDGAGGVSLSDVNYGSMVFNAVETNETTGEVGGFALNLKRGGTTQQYISIVGGTTSDTDNDSIVFSTGGTAAITVDNNQNVTFDTNTLFVDAEDNRVGIGNVDPQTALDVTGTVTATALDVDNINIDGNAITSTDTNGNIALTPDGTGEVDISKVDIDSGTIDDTTIGGSTPAAGSFTTGQFDTSLNVDGTVTVVANNTSRLADAANYIRFTDTDTSSATGQPIGEIQFYNSDSNGAGVNALIRGVSQFTSGITGMEFHTGFSNSTFKRMQLDWNGDISFYEDTGTTPKLFWDASAESLGIGTTTTGDVLDVEGTKADAESTGFDNSIVSIRNNEPSKHVGITFLGASGNGTVGQNARIGAYNVSAGTGYDGALTFSTRSGGTMGERMRLVPNGAVGIGTDDPQQAVHIANGSTVLHESSSPSYIFKETDRTDENFRLRQNGGNLIVESLTDDFSIVSDVARFQNDGEFRFNSGYGSAATAYGCRAWVNFNGTGTVAIREDGNVSSITDNGTGNYTVNFATAMPDANYSGNFTSNLNENSISSALVTTNATCITANSSGTLTDASRCMLAIFR